MRFDDVQFEAADLMRRYPDATIIGPELTGRFARYTVRRSLGGYVQEYNLITDEERHRPLDEAVWTDWVNLLAEC